MRTTRPWCVRKGLWICGLVALAAAFAGEAAAQTLNQNMCDPGDPFNIRPTWSPFAGAGFPLIRHTLDLQVHPDAVCNDGSPGVFYL